MPGPMPQHLVKTDALRDLDAFLSDPGKRDLWQEMLGLLETSNLDQAQILANDKWQILKDRPLSPSAVQAMKPSERAWEQDKSILKQVNGEWFLDEVKHMQLEWYAAQERGARPHAWNALAGPVEPIMRRSLIETIKLAQQKLAAGTPLPVDHYWMCAGADHDPEMDPASPGVNCYVAWNSTQITVIILTPEEPGQPAHHLHEAVGSADAATVDDSSHRQAASGIIAVKPTKSAGITLTGREAGARVPVDTTTAAEPYEIRSLPAPEQGAAVAPPSQQPS